MMAIYIIGYALLGIITGLIYKKVFPWRGTSSLKTYLIMGAVSSVICGLATQAILYFGHIVSQEEGTGGRYADLGPGDSSIGFDATGLWLSPFGAVLGALLIMTIYRGIIRYLYPE